ncbi:ADC synthase [Kalaharituber pfeilii]|nr:ADC synthase [Kalaharituber pfeilii]
MTSVEKPRILLLDFYDSFTHNLASLLRSSTGASVDVFLHDHFSTLPHLEADLKFYNALVIGPGPGSPEDPRDIGVVKQLWTALSPQNQLPIFGVCLGLQSLCIAFGGQLKRLNVVKHGIISEIEHVGWDIFDGVGTVKAVRYHSLHVDMNGSDNQIQELAWAADGNENGRVLMAAKHRTKPYWAVQYHPESICTEGGGESVIRNWWCLAQEWNRKTGRIVENLPAMSPKVWDKPKSLLERALKRGHNANDLPKSQNSRVNYATLVAPQLSSTHICEIMGSENQQSNFIFLDSAASPGRYSIIGVLSDISTQFLRYKAGNGFVEQTNLGETPKAFHRIDLHGSQAMDSCTGSCTGNCIWEYIATFMAERTVAKDCGPVDSPFWGGLVGYIAYEMGVHSLGLPLQSWNVQRPDIQLVYMQRSIVIDHFNGTIFIQTLRGDDGEWLGSTRNRLQLATGLSMTLSHTPPLTHGSSRNGTVSSNPILVEALSKASKPHHTVQVVRPKKERYLANIHKCQQYLSEGHSYELCLTALTQIHLSLPSPTPWTLFTNLRSRNPAPYSAYMRLSGVTIVSSSPERFLSWSRDGVCQLRPIKGTVKKTATTTLEYAKSMLYTPKEMAENLMIVDLIRHDLNQVAHEGTVDVRRLMKVEEYKSVYQLVSVIEGKVGPKDEIHSGGISDTNSPREPQAAPGSIPPTGFDVLARSLPPGSMTGAPKKRSVELLQGMEEEDRGLYSGVMGYWSVCGGGDWSVTIRTAFRYDDENDVTTMSEGASSRVGSSEGVQKRAEIWRIGAGGAITALSDPEAEWDEMEVKLESTLRAFIG